MRHAGTLVLALMAAAALAGCEGPSGLPGPTGAAGTNGEPGPQGPAGDKGQSGVDGVTGETGAPGEPGIAGPTGPQGDTGLPGNPMDAGTIMGVVKDAAGAPIFDALLQLSPGTVSGTSDVDGQFILLDVPIGAYGLTVTKAGHAPFALATLNVAAGATTLVNVTLTADTTVGPGAIEGTVVNTKEDPLEGVVVAIEGQTATAVTDADGKFAFADLAPGPVFVNATPPDGALYLPTETRRAVMISGGKTTAGVVLTLSARPSSGATYLGGGTCAICHSGAMNALKSSAHHRSLSEGTGRFTDTAKALWAPVGGIVDTQIDALDPQDGASVVRVYLCQSEAGKFAMKFGGAADACSGGTLVPVSGVYGGEGDRQPVDVKDPTKGVNQNFGVYKQRYLAKLADVPVAGAWDYKAAADKARDSLILPIQVTQSGDGSPKLAGYHGTDWTQRTRTFSHACAGCHNTGLKVETKTEGGSSLVTAYDYADLNVSCEMCHGPGSEHAEKGGGTGNFIINPKHMTATAQNQVCGKCHAADNGWSVAPADLAYPWNSEKGGAFVAGMHPLSDFLGGFGVPVAEGGGFNAWPDATHGLSHRQQYQMLQSSKHANNAYEKVTCADCHSVHTTYLGPSSLGFKNNALCLSCHAGYGPFADLSKDDVGALHQAAGGKTDKNGAPLSYSDSDLTAARLHIAKSVTQHMQDKVTMGNAAYDPLDDELPVGRCSSCHMPKTAKSGGWTTGADFTGGTALVEGDQASHVFDVIWPWQSAALKKGVGGKDTDIMPNSCGKCHSGSRVSGD